MSTNYMNQDQEGRWTGNITTAVYDINFWLRVRPSSENENAPCFDVITKSKHHGKEVKIGAVWEKKNRETGEVFYSITVDDPSLQQPLNVTAFPKEEPGEFEIVWSRPKKRTA